MQKEHHSARLTPLRWTETKPEQVEPSLVRPLRDDMAKLQLASGIATKNSGCVLQEGSEGSQKTKLGSGTTPRRFSGVDERWERWGRRSGKRSLVRGLLPLPQLRRAKIVCRSYRGLPAELSLRIDRGVVGCFEENESSPRKFGSITRYSSPFRVKLADTN